MEYYILKRGKPKGPFTIEELREQNLTPTTLVRPNIQDIEGEEQPYKSADKFVELFELFIEPTPPITPPEIKEEKKVKNSKIIPNVIAKETEQIQVTPETSTEREKVNESFFQKTKGLWAWTIGGLLVILVVGYLIYRSNIPKNLVGSGGGAIDKTHSKTKPNNDTGEKIEKALSEISIQVEITKQIESLKNNKDNLDSTVALKPIGKLIEILKKKSFKLTEKDKKILVEIKTKISEQINNAKNKSKSSEVMVKIDNDQIQIWESINTKIEEILNL